jgi:tight adherence protein B
MKKNRRIKRFQKQLPDALDLIARALKAGHAFTSGLKLAADELKDPIGTEFKETIDEINFGLSVSDALKNLTERVDCPDLRFFAVSVILQRETGGNLAEIMESLSSLIRKRFKFEGKVKILSSEGRFSAAVLLILPIVIGVLVQLLNPDYMEILYQEPSGRISIVVALISMAFGFLVIRRMIKINV